MIYSKEEFSKKLNKELKSAGLEEFSECADKLYTVVSRLDEFGKKFNLTAITDPDEVMKKHLIDCLFAAKAVKEAGGKKIIDIGSGAGFPSLPIAAALPDISVTALDSTAKKVGYMNDTASAAGMNNFRAEAGRAEEYVRGVRESFDTVTARAVASLPVLCELCIPYIKVGGKFIAMKGAAAEEEVSAAKSAAGKLGCSAAEILPYFLPGMDDKRYLVLFEKIAPTPEQFPRNFSQISKKPL